MESKENNQLQNKLESLEKENEKLKNVIKIIKEKDVNIHLLKQCKTLFMYNNAFLVQEKLSEKEYYSIVEVFNV